ncbi:heterokaryon incompatibility protein-domain-containing protein [Podospora appendiculata]|uniref:Heterokaryon incompatibility protein-domain-containing protein n=1 Tax=Podospora appendiculata TaxID=314037 RepID=A0AAE1C9H1_9PEZI|nr:heterokaryon incompatibility protein-domain-containing protein [Podospora appendiculata]
MDGSAKLFKRRIGKSGAPGPEVICEEERAATAQILRRLGGLPVAIEQTAAYMRKANVSILEYADFLQRNDAETSERGQKCRLVHHDSLEPIFDMSIRNLPQAQLKLLAVLSVSRVPVTKASFQIPEQYDKDWLSAPGDGFMQAFGGIHGFSNALVSLAKRSLVRVVHGRIEMNRLIQDFVVCQLTEEQVQDAFETVVHLRKRSRPQKNIGSHQVSSTTAEKTECIGLCACLFNYPKLDYGSNSFRLLRIMPGEPDMPIQCQLFTASLEEWRNRYLAGSYVWGIPEPIVSISINNRPFYIRQNLHSFLSVLRNTESSLVVWVDAICIDQSSDKERNHQVALMALIYKEASKTVAWLGPETQNSRQYVEYVDQHADHVNQYVDTWNINETASDSKTDDERQLVGRNFSQFMESEYWYRIWTFQELVLAQDIVLLWGSSRMEWDQFIQFIGRAAFGNDPKTEFDMPRVHDKALELEQLQGLRRGFKSRCLLDLVYDINVTGGRQCSRIHDRIYGLLGIVTCGHELERSFPIDYSTTTLQLFFEFVRRCGSNDTMKAIKVALAALKPSQSLLDGWQGEERHSVHLLPTDVYMVSSTVKTNGRRLRASARKIAASAQEWDPQRLFQCIRTLAQGEINANSIIYRLCDSPFALILHPRFTAGEKTSKKNREMDLVGLCCSSVDSRNAFVDANQEQLERKWIPELLRVTSSTVVVAHERRATGPEGLFTALLDTDLRVFAGMLKWLDERKVALQAEILDGNCSSSV